MRLYIFTSKLKHLRSAPLDRATTSQCSAVVHLRSATSSQWYIFAVLQWTEPHSSGTSSQCSAVVHLRSGTSSQCSSGQSHFPVVHLRSAPTEPHSSSTSSQCSVPPSFLFLFQTSFLFLFCQTSFLFLSFLSRYCHTRYCHTRYCHIWVFCGHLILFCAWLFILFILFCAAAGGRITINQNEPNVVIRQSSIQYRTARSRRGMPRHATCRQQDTKLCCRCALPTMEEPWMQQRELDEVFGPKSMMHIEPRSVLLLVNH